MAESGEREIELLRERFGAAWARNRQRIAGNRRFWALVEPYRPPTRLMPLLLLNVAAFYTGVVAAAITEQLYKVSFRFRFLVLGLHFCPVEMQSSCVLCV